MTDRKGKQVPPVQVIRRPAGSPSGAPAQPEGQPAPAQPEPTQAPAVVPHVVKPVVPVRPAVAPSSVRPTGAVPGPAVAPSAVRPTGAAPRPVSPGPRSAGPGLGGREGPRSGPPRFRPSGPPRPPPTTEQIHALAKKERVPNRIAKGELEGKMKCRIWKKLHAEEARRFDQAWTLAEKTPGLDLADAFGIVQSGMTVDEFSARRARSRKKEEIKEARASVQGAPIDGFINTLIAARAELSILLGERTVLDVIVAAHPVAFDLERSGKIEKLQVVLVARKGTWDRVSATVEREPKHTQKPAGVARQPSRRPVNDPRQFLDQVGKPITVALRNGIIVKDTLIAVGPFDVLLGTEGEEIFIPLHAMLTWSAA